MATINRWHWLRTKLHVSEGVVFSRRLINEVVGQWLSDLIMIVEDLTLNCSKYEKVCLREPRDHMADKASGRNWVQWFRVFACTKQRIRLLEVISKNNFFKTAADTVPSKKILRLSACDCPTMQTNHEWSAPSDERVMRYYQIWNVARAREWDFTAQLSGRSPHLLTSEGTLAHNLTFIS